jgi:hypothetical protein
VIPVLFLLMFMVIVALCMVVVWPIIGVAPGTTGGTIRARTVPPSVPAMAEPRSLEGVLTEQLAEGGINRRQYIRAMESLAARDAERHPLHVPPDAAPPGTGSASAQA